MKDTKIVAVYGEGICPHCNKLIKYSVRQTSPVVYWMLKQEDIDKSKKRVKDEVSKISFRKPENKQAMLDWLEREDTIIGPDEAENIIEQTKNEEENKE